jgi:hypothetical protein
MLAEHRIIEILARRSALMEALLTRFYQVR